MEAMESQTENKFESMLYQTEIERVKYLLKSYLRCRLWKASAAAVNLTAWLGVGSNLGAQVD